MPRRAGRAAGLKPEGASTDVDCGLSNWPPVVRVLRREAVPHDPLPSRERLGQIASEGRHQFWIIDGDPVSMGGIVRRTRHAAAIAGVYLTTKHRNWRLSRRISIPALCEGML